MFTPIRTKLDISLWLFSLFVCSSTTNMCSNREEKTMSDKKAHDTLFTIVIKWSNKGKPLFPFIGTFLVLSLSQYKAITSQMNGTTLEFMVTIIFEILFFRLSLVYDANNLLLFFTYFVAPDGTKKTTILHNICSIKIKWYPLHENGEIVNHVTGDFLRIFWLGFYDVGEFINFVTGNLMIFFLLNTKFQELKNSKQKLDTWHVFWFYGMLMFDGWVLKLCDRNFEAPIQAEKNNFKKSKNS